MKYVLSSYKMSVFVETDQRDIIIDTANITRKFIGQPINNLRNWLRRQGGFWEEAI